MNSTPCHTIKPGGLFPLWSLLLLVLLVMVVVMVEVLVVVVLVVVCLWLWGPSCPPHRPPPPSPPPPPPPKQPKIIAIQLLRLQFTSMCVRTCLIFDGVVLSRPVSI